MDIYARELLKRGTFSFINVSSETKTLGILGIIYIYLKQEIFEVLQ